MEQETGLLVLNVESDSPAERAGVLLGDTLIGLGERSLAEITALQDALGPGSAGQTEAMRLIRAGQLAEVNITIGER